MKYLTSKALIERIYGSGDRLNESYRETTYCELDDYLPLEHLLIWDAWHNGVDTDNYNHELYGVTEKDLVEHFKTQGVRYTVFHVGDVSYYGFNKNWYIHSYKDVIIKILADRNKALTKKAA